MPMPLRYLRSELSILCICAVLICGCNNPKPSAEADVPAPPPVQEVTNTDYEVAEDKSSLTGYYNLDHIKEWYSERILPPVFDYNVDLSGKTVVELSLLRNEVFARNGYLFDDAVLRGYFNQFSWYQPIFDVPDFKVQLTKQEQDFVDKVLSLENELVKERYTMQGDHNMISLDHLYNQMQFKAIEEPLTKALASNNFAIVPASHAQFFHVYDNNHYEYIPNFITTDFYLQVLHKHFSSLLQKVEEEKFIPVLTNLLEGISRKSIEFERTADDVTLKKAAQWTAAYVGIAGYLISGTAQITPHMDGVVKSETQKILNAQGTGSQFLKAPLFQYSQFTPRGNYTKTKELARYFRCVKWLNSAPISMDEDERFFSAILIASIIKNSPEDLKLFQQFNEAIRFIVGEEDNLSISTLISILSREEAANPSVLFTPEKLNALKEKLKGLNIDKINPKGGDGATADEFSKPVILFTAGRYTFDAEILSRLIHVLQPDPGRTFPKGMDVFATLGNREAEKILISEYREAQQWKAYPDSLEKLKNEFSAFSNWNQNIYSKTMEAIRSLDHNDARYPLFMKTPSWERKNLVTSLAAWTELKHDMLLYSEQPMAAQAGEGGGPPPPLHISYVEPNVKFWEKSLELLTFQEETLLKMDLLPDNTADIIKDLKEIGNLLLTVSRKELANEKITREEFEYLSWLGGRIEYLTFRIFDSDHLPEKERYVALVADVYNYNGKFLEEAVGMVDEIYVVTEINGKPYLTKGAVFSYYEFKSDTPLTDEAWREQITSGTEPERPVWVKDIMVRTKSLESKPGYSF
jgi:hypothetical protein